MWLRLTLLCLTIFGGIPTEYGTSWRFARGRAQNPAFYERYYDSGGREGTGAFTISGDRLVLAGSTDFETPDRATAVIHVLDRDGELTYSARSEGTTRTFFTALSPVTLNGRPGVVAGAWNNSFATIDDLNFYVLNDVGEGTAFGWGRPQEDEQIRHLLTLDNGDLVAVGNVGTSNNALVVCFGPDGTLRWRCTLSVAGSRFNVLHQSAVTDGGIVLTGYSTPDERRGDTWVAKVSPAGDLLWSYRYAVANQRSDALRTILPLPNGDLVVTSSVAASDDERAILFLRLTADGEVLTTRQLDAPGEDVARATLLTPAGNVLLVGWMDDTPSGKPTGLVMELDPDGNVLRQRTVANFAESRLTAAHPAPNCGYYLAGNGTECSVGNQDMLLVYLTDELTNDHQACATWPATLSSRPAPAATRTAGGDWAERTDPPVPPAPLARRTYTLTDGRCPEDFFTLPPTSPLTLCAGDSTRYDFTVPEATDYRWDDGPTAPSRTFAGPGTRRLTVSDGCVQATLAVEVRTESCCELYVPTAFSPNGDGVNDRFAAQSGADRCAALTDYSLQVYDRWGGLLAERRDVADGWDGRVNGRPAPTGTYLYRIAFFDGLTVRQREGTVVLLR